MTSQHLAVPSTARALARDLAALFAEDQELAHRLNDAQTRLRDATEQLWSGLHPDAHAMLYDDTHAVSAGRSQPQSGHRSDARPLRGGANELQLRTAVLTTVVGDPLGGASRVRRLPVRKRRAPTTRHRGGRAGRTARRRAHRGGLDRARSTQRQRPRPRRRERPPCSMLTAMPSRGRSLAPVITRPASPGGSSTCAQRILSSPRPRRSTPTTKASGRPPSTFSSAATKSGTCSPATYSRTRRLRPVIEELAKPRRAWSSSEYAVMEWSVHFWNLDRWPAKFPYVFEHHDFERWITACHLYMRITPAHTSSQEGTPCR